MAESARVAANPPLEGPGDASGVMHGHLSANVLQSEVSGEQATMSMLVDDASSITLRPATNDLRSWGNASLL